MSRLIGWPPRAGTDDGRRVVAVALYSILAIVCAVLIAQEGHPEAWLALIAAPLAFIKRFGGLAIGVALVLGGAWLRFLVGSLGDVAADQLVVTQAAIEIVLQGGNPYGVGYPESVPPGSPFVYGPLMLVWGWTGPWGEALASVATLGLVALTRSWVTLAVLAAFPLFVIITTVGINDSTPGFFITAALLALRTRPLLGGVLLAVAVGLKPYALAWVPGVVAYGGVRAAIGAGVVSAVAWAPLLAWGPTSFMRSTDLAREVHAESPGGALGLPALRILAAPVVLVALLVRRWTVAALSGSAIFIIVLFFDTWASFGYWLAVLPITGIAVEALFTQRWAERQTIASVT